MMSEWYKCVIVLSALAVWGSGEGGVFRSHASYRSRFVFPRSVMFLYPHLIPPN